MASASVSALLRVVGGPSSTRPSSFCDCSAPRARFRARPSDLERLRGIFGRCSRENVSFTHSNWALLLTVKRDTGTQHITTHQHINSSSLHSHPQSWRTMHGTGPPSSMHGTWPFLHFEGLLGMLEDSSSDHTHAQHTRDKLETMSDTSQEEGTARRESKRAQWTYNPEMEIHISHNLLDAPSPSHHAHLEPKPARRRSHGACPRAPCSMHSKCFRTASSRRGAHEPSTAPTSPLPDDRRRCACRGTGTARAWHRHGRDTAGRARPAQAPSPSEA